MLNCKHFINQQLYLTIKETFWFILYIIRTTTKVLGWGNRTFTSLCHLLFNERVFHSDFSKEKIIILPNSYSYFSPYNRNDNLIVSRYKFTFLGYRSLLSKRTFIFLFKLEMFDQLKFILSLSFLWAYEVLCNLVYWKLSFCWK